VAAIVSKLGEEEFSELYETLSRLSAEERECMAEEYGSQQTETLESTRDAAWTMCHLFYLEDKLMECSRMLQQEG